MLFLYLRLHPSVLTGAVVPIPTLPVVLFTIKVFVSTVKFVVNVRALKEGLSPDPSPKDVLAVPPLSTTQPVGLPTIKLLSTLLSPAIVAKSES